MLNTLFSTAANKSNATTASRLGLFGRVFSNVKTAFRMVRIEEKNVLGQEEENDRLPEPSQEGPIHLLRNVHLIEEESTSASEHVAGAASVSTLPPRPSVSPITTPSPTPSTTTSSVQSSVQSLQVINALEAAKKRITELETTIATRRLEHAAYVQRVKRMNMPHAIKKLTEERDLFRARLEPAKQEYARKAAERKLVQQEWKEEEERRLTAQLMVMGAKYGLEESAKLYAELEAKYLELEKQPESA
ncbi:hypothetical protein FRC00_013883 [Tulasnella sp. 408]|nr:hypothetical protein FRC00_013883 [Tulasnella sp. 408]